MQYSLWSMFSTIRNGSVARRKSVIHPKNSLCLKVLRVLYNEGYINGFRTYPGNFNNVEIFLKYGNSKPAVNNILSMSKPGRRIYVSVTTLWKLKTSLLTLIVSTPRGVLSDKECRKCYQGGEVLCVVS